ncbi:hypothetical protein FOCC_FOCC006740, partial [Frankliniella occidentalis]
MADDPRPVTPGTATASAAPSVLGEGEAGEPDPAAAPALPLPPKDAQDQPTPEDMVVDASDEGADRQVQGAEGGTTETPAPPPVEIPAQAPTPTPAPEQPPPPPPPPTPAPPVVEVPPCDLFEIGNLPDMCPHSDSCLTTSEEGCFLALIKRKEIVRMDANYMIKMAEARGLFGCAPGVRRPTAAERARKKREREEAEARARGVGARRGKGGPLDVERLSAPTRASRARQHRIPPRPRRASNMSWESDDSHEGPEITVVLEDCPRFQQHMQAAREALGVALPAPGVAGGRAPGSVVEVRRRDARRWWSETSRWVPSAVRELRPAIRRRDRQCLKSPLLSVSVFPQ